MEPVYLSIRQKETGDQIKRLLKENGYSVKDIQSAMGFENPQAIYKWMSGRSLPSLDNLIILSRILHISMEDILVIDGDVVFYAIGLLNGRCACTSAFFNRRFNDNTLKLFYALFRTKFKMLQKPLLRSMKRLR